MSIFNKIFKLSFLLIIMAELVSLLGYYYPYVNKLVFLAVIFIALAATFYKLEYGLYMLLAELFIGSFGYLFYFEQGGLKISLRLALWLIVMSVWLGQTILSWIKNKRLSADFFKSPYFNYFFILFIFIVWALVSGFLNGNSFANIFQDFDNWLFFLLIFPVFSVLQTENSLRAVKQIFFAATSWLSIKTLLLTYFFSHSFSYFTLDLYRWIRDSRLGEITQVAPGFSRIFMQSQIFVLIGFFLVVIASVSEAISRTATNQKRLLTFNFLLSALFFSAIITSFSRSFWAGLIAGLLFLLAVYFFRKNFNLKKLIRPSGYLLGAAFLGMALTAAVVKFPYPAPSGRFNSANLIEDRATAVAGEAGAASRWQLLTPLWQKIISAPILGRGFGATVTYKSSDPRVLASNPGGIYTTYAFEWGWLDVWLKLGLFGLLAYLALFAKLIFDGLKINSYFSLSLITGLIVLMAVNAFSPYINHPLGIGYLLLAAVMLEQLSLRAPYSGRSNLTD